MVTGVASASCGSQSEAETIQFFENPQLSNVTSVRIDTPSNCIQGATGMGSASTVSNYWSGWRVWYESSGTNLIQDYETTYFYQPTGYPNEYCFSAEPYECELAIWGGLDNANGFIAQTGTFRPFPALCAIAQLTLAGMSSMKAHHLRQACGSSDVVSPGDSMESIAENGLSWGGSLQAYDLYLLDTPVSGTSWVCSASTTYSGGITTLSETILEIPVFNNILGQSYNAFLTTFNTVDNYENLECYYLSGSSTCVPYTSSASNGWDYSASWTTTSGLIISQTSVWRSIEQMVLLPRPTIPHAVRSPMFNVISVLSHEL